MAARRVRPAPGPLDVALEATPSKSVTHRALLAAAIARGTSRIERPLDSEDTLATRAGLRALGIGIEAESDAWLVEGSAGRFPGGATLDLGESGTSLRFLTAFAALGERESRIDGGARLRERPVAGLVDALATLGAIVRYETPRCGIPLATGGRRPEGRSVSLPGGETSQFASALALVAPVLPRGLEISLVPPIVSAPYLELTIGVLEAFGVEVERTGPLSIRVPPGVPEGRAYRIEGDHSSASYLLAAAAVVGGRVRVLGLDPGSRQGDAAFSGILERLGCEVRRGTDFVEVLGSGDLPGFDLDAGDVPDLVPTLAAIAAVASGPSRLGNVSHLRAKESDRLETLAENLGRLGRSAHASGGTLEIGPPAETREGVEIRTRGDHRIAMAFAVSGLRTGLAIDDPGCVAKSYPGFWEDFAALERPVRTGS